jgi:methylmalonyl-CoA epimerase
MNIRLDHIGIAVPDLEAGSAFWRLLGLLEGEDEVNQDQGVKLRFFDTAPAEEPTRIELLEPLGEDTPIGRFLASQSPGVQQVAFRVDDLQTLLDRLKAAGIQLIHEHPVDGAHGSKIAFVHPKSTGGVLVELLER